MLRSGLLAGLRGLTLFFSSRPLCPSRSQHRVAVSPPQATRHVHFLGLVPKVWFCLFQRGHAVPLRTLFRHRPDPSLAGAGLQSGEVLAGLGGSPSSSKSGRACLKAFGIPHLPSRKASHVSHTDWFGLPPGYRCPSSVPTCLFEHVWHPKTIWVTEGVALPLDRASVPIRLSLDED